MNNHHVTGAAVRVPPVFDGEPGDTAGPDEKTIIWRWRTRFGRWEGSPSLPPEVRVTSESGLPTDAAERKAVPIATGVLDYFPDAIAEIARVSKVGNDQHNPGQPLHWAKEKSSDEADALVRHLLERGKRDVDGMRHSAKVAWRALALLQRELDAER